jgi:hypothetical protein
MPGTRRFHGCEIDVRRRPGVIGEQFDARILVIRFLAQAIFQLIRSFAERSWPFLSRSNAIRASRAGVGELAASIQKAAAAPGSFRMIRIV